MRSQLGLALVRLGRFDDAESLLLESAEKLPLHQARTPLAYAAVADFFRERDRLEPGAAYAPRAAQWQRRSELDSNEP